MTLFGHSNKDSNNNGGNNNAQPARLHKHHDAGLPNNVGQQNQQYQNDPNFNNQSAQPNPGQQQWVSLCFIYRLRSMLLMFRWQNGPNGPNQGPMQDAQYGPSGGMGPGAQNQPGYDGNANMANNGGGYGPGYNGPGQNQNQGQFAGAGPGQNQGQFPGQGVGAGTGQNQGQFQAQGAGAGTGHHHHDNHHDNQGRHGVTHHQDPMYPSPNAPGAQAGGPAMAGGAAAGMMGPQTGGAGMGAPGVNPDGAGYRSKMLEGKLEQVAGTLMSSQSMKERGLEKEQ